MDPPFEIPPMPEDGPEALAAWRLRKAAWERAQPHWLWGFLSDGTKIALLLMWAINFVLGVACFAAAWWVFQ